MGTGEQLVSSEEKGSAVGRDGHGTWGHGLVVDLEVFINGWTQ